MVAMLEEFAFWCCAGMVTYIYVGYPFLIFLISLVTHRSVKRADFLPHACVIIAAFNEEEDIKRTVLNKLEQDYPQERLSVIVVSDGSTDRTDAVVEEIIRECPLRVRLLRQEPRQGKTAALNLGVGAAISDVVIFCDANSVYATDAVQRLVACLFDSSVGYVTGRMSYISRDSSGFAKNSDSYIQYENCLRALETRVGSVVGVDGGIDAIWRKLYTSMRSDQLPDFVLPLRVIQQGKRVVYEPSAVLYEDALSRARDEFSMRVRVGLRALWALHDERALLNPFRYPLFAWQLVSHKLMRYLAFLPLGGLFAFSALALGESSPIYGVCFAVQLVAYTFAGVGHFLANKPNIPALLLAPYYFVVLNSACALAAYNFLLGKRIVLWKPRTGA